MNSVEWLFWMLVAMIGSFILLMTSIGYLIHSQDEWGIDFKKRRIGYICLPTGMLLMLWSTVGMLSSIDGTSYTGAYLMSFFMYLLIPANEFDRMAYYAPYGQEEIEKKFKRAKICTYILLGVLELFAFRVLFYNIIEG